MRSNTQQRIISFNKAMSAKGDFMVVSPRDGSQAETLLIYIWQMQNVYLDFLSIQNSGGF